MSRIKVCVVLMAFVAFGCARNSQVADEAAVAPSDETAALAAAPSADSGDVDAVIPDAVIDANDLVASTPPRPICREMLRPNSNVRTKRCMTAESWAIYDRAEAQRAGELLRTWQGGAYR